MELELFCECPSAPSGATVDGRGRLLFPVAGHGSIFTADESSALAPPYATHPAVDTGGSPTGCAFDADGVLFIADQAHQAVLTTTATGPNSSTSSSSAPLGSSSVETLVTEHEDARLLGPHAVAFAPDGTLFFSDPGPEGETGIAARGGSVYAVTPDGQLLTPLALRALARPTGVAVSRCGRFVFVCETGANRVLRFCERPRGVWHGSVFVSFSGLAGPIDCAIDPETGDLFVARFEYADPSGESVVGGVVSTVTMEGHVVEEVSTPHPEITGIAFRSEGGVNFLYISEASSKSIYRMRVQNRADQDHDDAN